MQKLLDTVVQGEDAELDDGFCKQSKHNIIHRPNVRTLTQFSCITYFFFSFCDRDLQLIFYRLCRMPVSVPRAEQCGPHQPVLRPGLAHQHGRAPESAADASPRADDREVQHSQHGPWGHEPRASDDARNAFWALRGGGDHQGGCRGQPILLGGELDHGQGKPYVTNNFRDIKSGT